MHAKQHDIFFRRDWELNPSPSGSHVPRALASVLAHRATRAGITNTTKQPFTITYSTTRGLDVSTSMTVLILKQ